MPSIICKRGKKRYRASVTVQRITRQKLFPDATKKSYRKAIVWENEIRKKIAAQLSRINSESLLIGNWVNEYLKEADNHFSIKTFKEKRSAFVRLIDYADLKPDFPVENLTNTIVRKFLKKQFKERSGNAANKDRKNLGTAWNWGRDNIEGWPTVQNPFLSVKKFPEIRKPRYVPPEDDFWRIYDVAEGQDRIMLLAMLHLAGRRSEIFRLKWSDVDFANNLVRLSTRKREGGNLEYDWLPMTSELREALQGWRRERMVQSTIDKEHVFVCLDETPFCDNFYGRPFVVRQHFMKKICQRADVKPFGFHAIRHLTASILYRKGYSQAHIQAVLRHKNPNTTARYLRTLGLEETREALERGLRGPAKIITFQKGKTPRSASSEG